MKLPSGVVIAVLVGSTGLAATEPCAVAAKATREAMHSIEAVGQTAFDMTSKCLFDGPDDKLVDKLGAAATAAFADKPLPDEALKCKRPPPDLKPVFGAIGQAVGIRVGLAYATCSTKVTSYIAQQLKKGVAPDAIRTAVQKMGDTWLDTLHK